MSLSVVITILTYLFLVLWCASLARRQRRLDAISLYDTLTGLLSGRVFERERWPAAVRDTAPVAFLFIDLDDLKARNSADGHKAGDAYIVSAAKHLERRRGVDQVFRLHGAGDEFGILIQGPEARKAGEFARVLVSDLAKVGISASVGAVATESVEHKVRASVYAAAEAAMREAKIKKGCAVARVI